MLASRILDRSGNGGSIRRPAVAVCEADCREALGSLPRLDGLGLMPKPDLLPCFQALHPEEQSAVLRWEEELGVNMEGIPPLRAMVETLALVRVVEGLEGSVEGRWQEAAASLGMDPGAGDTIRRRLNHWRSKTSGENLPDLAKGMREIGSGR